MFNRKYIFTLLLLIIGLSCLTAVSANDTDNQTLASDESLNEVISADEIISEEADDKLTASPEETLEKDLTNQELSYTIYSPSADNYRVKFKYGTYNQVGSHKDKDILYTLTPYATDNIYFYKYDFSLRVYDSYTNDTEYYYWGNKVYDSGRICGQDISEKTECKVTIPAKTFKAGTYYLVMINTADNTIMAGPNKINVKDTAVISTNDYNAFYNSGAQMTVRLTDSKSGEGIKGDLKATFSNGAVKYYTTDSNGYVTFTPPLNIGTYTVTFAPVNANLNAGTVKKNVNIKKATVTMKAFKVTEYKGFKAKLKVTVKSYGKNVNEGTVKFKINGKTYKANVKNGVASVKVKLSKVKTYKYTAKFTGSNFNSKTAKSKAVIKKRLATKIVVKNQKVYSNQIKTFTIKIKTASGKKVKDGWIKLGSEKVKVKNGKVKLVKYGLGTKHLKKISTLSQTYKKSITKKYKLKYIPASHKYKPSTKKVKVTSVFKCACGKTKTHYHYRAGYYIIYKFKINVV